MPSSICRSGPVFALDKRIKTLSNQWDECSLSRAGRPRSQRVPNRVQTIAMVSMAASTPGSPKSASGTPVEAPAGSR